MRAYVCGLRKMCSPSLSQTFPKCDILLDNEAQDSGVFLPELDEPEYCNPQNTALWELHTLRVNAQSEYTHREKHTHTDV